MKRIVYLLYVSQSGDGASQLVIPNIKVPKNGYAYVYLSNENAEAVYFDDFKVAHIRGRIIEENHYYAFGLKIAGISSAKFGDENEGSLKNDYQYQGDFSEMDKKIGWNDFLLRNYDAQIGRWIQQDPFQQFPSPYTGMGNDPINNIDSSGGWAASGIFEGMSKAGIIATTTIGGAIIGGAVDAITGGDGLTGVLMGAGIGLGSNLSFGNFSSKSSSIGINILSKGVNFEQQISVSNSYAKYAGYNNIDRGTDVWFKNISDQKTYPDIEIYETSLINKRTAVTLPYLGWEYIYIQV